MGITSLVESSAVGAASATAAALLKRRLTRQVMEETLRKSLGISCMFMWVILAALAFGSVFDGLGAVDVRIVENANNLGFVQEHLPAFGHAFFLAPTSGRRVLCLRTSGTGGPQAARERRGSIFRTATPGPVTWFPSP
jgi:hypothetical protein